MEKEDEILIHINETKKKIMRESAKMLDEQAGNFVINLKHTINNRLETVAAEALGFNMRYNKVWDIDHCNGRSSIITGLISDKVKKIAQKAFDKIFTEERILEIMKRAEKDILKELESGIKKQLTHDIERQMKDKLEKQAEKFAEEWIESLKIQTKFDLANPQTADTKLGAAFMKMTADEATEDK